MDNVVRFVKIGQVVNVVHSVKIDIKREERLINKYLVRSKYEGVF